MQPGLQEPRPPYVRFDMRAVEKRDASGNVRYEDVPYAIVTPHGARDSVEKIVPEWFPILKEEVRQGRFPQTWLDSYNSTFNAWKNDQILPVNGTSIKNWPSASPAEVAILSRLGIVAVEDLAQANAELQNRIGMGAVSLVNRAKNFLEAQKDTAPLVAQLDAQAAIINTLTVRLNTLEEGNRLLQAQLAASKQYVGQVATSGNVPQVEDLFARLDLVRVPQNNEGQLIAEVIDEALDGQ